MNTISHTMTTPSTLPTADKSPSKSFTRFLPAIGRVLLGLPLVIFGLNGFFNFIPPPPTPLPAGAAAFAGALMNTGYMMQLIGATQLISGLMLLTNRFVPLALVLLAPFFVNSLAFHIFLEHSGLPMALIFCALELALAWAYRRAYATLLTARFVR
jgi:hypothetical protein